MMNEVEEDVFEECITSPPDDRELRLLRRTVDGSLNRYNTALQVATLEPLDQEVQGQSELQSNMNQAMADSLVYIDALKSILMNIPEDQQDKIRKYQEELMSAERKRDAIPTSYADKMHELSDLLGRRSNHSIHNVERPAVPHNDANHPPDSHHLNNDRPNSVRDPLQQFQPRDSQSEPLLLPPRIETQQRRVSQSVRSNVSRSSKYSTVSQNAAARLEEIELEDEYERKRLEREREKILLRQSIRDSRDDLSRKSRRSKSHHSSAGSSRESSLSGSASNLQRSEVRVQHHRPDNVEQSNFHSANKSLDQPQQPIHDRSRYSYQQASNLQQRDIQRHGPANVEQTNFHSANKSLAQRQQPIQSRSIYNNEHDARKQDGHLCRPEEGTSHGPADDEQRITSACGNNHSHNVMSDQGKSRYNHDFDIDLLWQSSNSANQPHLSSPLHKSSSTGSADSGLVDKLLHLRVMERRGKKFSGNPLEYTSFRNEFSLIIKRFHADIPYLVEELFASVTGEALEYIEHVRDLLDDPLHALQTALTVLKRNYGSNFQVRQAHLKSLTDQTKKVRWDATSFRKLLSDLEKCRALMRQPCNQVHLNSPETIYAIVERLPTQSQHAFVKACSRLNDPDNPGFDFLVRFIEDEHKQTSLSFSKLLQSQKNVKKSTPVSKYGYGNSGMHATAALNVDEQNDGSPSATVKEDLVSTTSVMHKSHVPENKLNTVKQTKSYRDTLICQFCQATGHQVQKCFKFRRIPLADKWAFIQGRSDICQQCCRNHPVTDCNTLFLCHFCGKKDHHSILCSKNPDNGKSSAHTDNKKTSNNGSGSSALVTSGFSNPTTSLGPVYVRVVPVTVTARSGESVNVYALLDSGSNTTLGTHELAKFLGVNESNKKKMKIEGVNSVCEVEALEISVTISGCGVPAHDANNNSYQLHHIPCIPSLPAHSPSIPRSSITAQHPHLSDIQFPLIERNQIDLIIGADYEQLHQVLESRTDANSQLLAHRTPLGWVLAGRNDKMTVSVSSITSVSCMYNWERKPTMNDTIDDLTLSAVQDMMHQCVEKPGDENVAPSVEDERVIDLFVKKKKKTDDNHFILPIPFRNPQVQIPNNKSMALSRFESLRRQLKKDPDLRTFYVEKMRDTIGKGYLRRFNSSIPVIHPNRVVYLPHFPTRQTKRRIVIDAAQTHLGESFNGHLMQGPDMMQSLVDILVRFRQDGIAFVCDIKEMFHQVKIPEEDQPSIRLLWFEDDDINSPPVEYMFTVHAFGWKSSPAAANFAVRQTALDNESQATQHTVNIMMKQLYVDDCLNSEQTVEDAIFHAKELNVLAETSGFRFVKYVSNSAEFLQSLNQELLIPELKEIGSSNCILPTHKALGVFWDASTDKLVIRIHIKKMPETKRGLLSMLHQIFDPLGISIPYLISGRMILQEAFLSTEQNDWDTLLPANLRRGWNRWLDDLSALENISIPRCYHVTGQRPSKYEVHTFADASNVGLGAVSYLRFFQHNTWCCSFIRGKGHILPKGTSWSVARYELEAAVMAADLHSAVLSALELNVINSFLWSDSATVLSWITNTIRRPKVFVYNRRKRILRNSCVQQWKYVNTQHNPADLATRNRSPSKASTDILWISGPEFLLLPEQDWPVWDIPQAKGFEVEMVPDCKVLKTTSTISGAAEKQPFEEGDDDSTTIMTYLSPQEKLFQLLWKYSSLHKLLRVIAWLSRLASKKHTPDGSGQTSDIDSVAPLQYPELEAAKLCAIRLAQLEYFSSSIMSKIKSKGFNNAFDTCRDSGLKTKLKQVLKLSPFVDDDGLLKVGGRLQNADVPETMKHPIILPRRHQVTRLIVEDIHIKNRHFGGASFVLNNLHASFSIGSSTVRFYLRGCLPCVQIRAAPGRQIMAPLPADRVSTGGQPFQATGVDYFGPVAVKVLRSQQKRWVALFTCLATRAIHLEKVTSLKTSSFLQAFLRFRCSRGNTVKILHSDNATTFHGADEELKRALNRLESEGFGRKLQYHGVDWKYNSPLASHQGGSWERLIRSVRKVLLGIPALQNREPTDETLDTYLKEAESIVNLRPLTQLNGDPDELPALTPSMLLTGSFAPTVPIDIFHSADQLKSDWRYTQIAAQQFWERFLKEYLTTLNPRHKWQRSTPSFQVDDIVLVKEAKVNYRPLYPKARVTSLFPGPDGNVRNVEIRFADGRVLVRDIRKLVPLERHCDDTNSTNQ